MACDEEQRARRVVQLSDGKRKIRTARCPRCKRRVLLRRPWAGWRHLRWVWFGLLLAFLPLLPAMAFDACVMLPAFVLFITAIGPLNALARMPPACTRCGLSLLTSSSSPARPGGAEVILLRPRRPGDRNHAP